MGSNKYHTQTISSIKIIYLICFIILLLVYFACTITVDLAILHALIKEMGPVTGTLYFLF